MNRTVIWAVATMLLCCGAAVAGEDDWGTVEEWGNTGEAEEAQPEVPDQGTPDEEVPEAEVPDPGTPDADVPDEGEAPAEEEVEEPDVAPDEGTTEEEAEPAEPETREEPIEEDAGGEGEGADW